MFKYGITEVLKAYSSQYCNGIDPSLHVMGTFAYKQEINHVILVRPPQDGDCILPPVNESNSVIYNDESVWKWKPEATSDRWHKPGLFGSELGVRWDARRWEHATFAFQIPEDSENKILRLENLEEHMKYCEAGDPFRCHTRFKGRKWTLGETQGILYRKWNKCEAFNSVTLWQQALIQTLHIKFQGQGLNFTQWYNETDSILGNEILREILLSLLFELKEVTFSLQLKNSSFLDVTWELPEYKFYEFVPSEDLGLDIRTIKGFPIVTQVDPASIAGEDNKIEVGDVLDEMCGQYMKGVGKSGGRSKDGTTYSYIAKLMERAKLGGISPTSPASPTSQSSSFDEDRLPPDAQLPEEIEDEVPVYDSEGRASYEAMYLGKSFLGKDGRVSMIEQGVGKVLNRSTSKQCSGSAKSNQILK